MKRRVTLTLPIRLLKAAEREGQRRVKAFEAFGQAVSDLTDEQWQLLDGIIMEPTDEET